MTATAAAELIATHQDSRIELSRTRGSRFVFANLNGRDLGGLRLCGGGFTTRGRLFRIAFEDGFPLPLPALDQSGVAHPTHIFDLRTANERKSHPQLACGTHVHVHNLPITDPNFHATPRHRRDDAFWVRHYTALLEPAAFAARQIFESLCRAPGRVIVGCRLGKDRTGVVTLLLLTVLGVRRKDVVADFALTARAYRRSEPWVERYALARGEDSKDVMRSCQATTAVAERTLYELSRRATRGPALNEFIGIEPAQVDFARRWLTSDG